MLQKLILFFCLFLPFQFALSPATGIDLASIRIFVLILFFWWIFKSLYKKNLRISLDWQTLFVFSFLFLASFSLFFAQNTHWASRKLVFLFSIFPLYFVFKSRTFNEKWVEKISSFLVFGSFGVATVGIAQFFAQFIFKLDSVLIFWRNYVTPFFLGGAFSQSVVQNSSWLVNISGKTIFRAISIFPDPHMFSFYLGMTTPIALFLFFKNKQRKFFLMFFVILLADLLTFSRGGYIALTATVLFLGFVFLKDVLRSHKHRGAFFLTILSIFVFLVLTPVKTRFLASFNLNEGSNVGRIEMWTNALQTIQKNPLGVGLGNFPLEVNPLATYRTPIYAHSLYLDIASEMGIPTLLIWLAIISFSLYTFLIKSKGNVLYFGCAAALLIFSIHSFVETPLFSVHVLPLFLIIISFANAKPIKQDN